ncbi:branched-chain amino acid aminotransferase [Pectinatus cerevisiiphilus]|uniref:branched-chain-amino-acid transaminase n=1 Tax=Pectinatus cerevisiiphilus TaxID=86956 RepID=A0A4R3K9R2_9FIRM|nr:branched-chain amino acid aminotransferase [Pectinatus cerevisiiphilus]TCS79688.1 branched chain amino acid aminotransferase /branched chain amino acid: 2-keto-4-methylthiobutyrate aminotransferase [Pectinatus cerevisiiphilus]
MTTVKFVKAPTLKEKPDVSKIGFGTHFTDHMFEMTYTTGKGWHDPQIIPYNNISISPANATIHYGQAIFEGMKAFRQGNKVVIFRPLDHLKRLNNSARILDIPPVDIELVHNALRQLITIEKDWVPNKRGQSLYIRPFIYADDGFLGVSVGKSYKMYIILSPVAAYYAHGFAPVNIMVEDTYVRATKGGLGEAKTPANYAASLHAGLVAHQKGYDQTLWLDGVERKYIEEVGSMNILFKINGEIVTPELDGSILSGITRRTVLQVAKEWGYPVSERRISIDEIKDAYKKGVLEEVFGSGTAAVISPVGVLGYKGEDMVINDNQIGPFAQKMFDYVTGVQCGAEKDTHNFTEFVTEV